MVEGRREKVFYAASGGEGWREKFTYRAKTMPAFTLQRSGATLVLQTISDQSLHSAAALIEWTWVAYQSLIEFFKKKE